MKAATLGIGSALTASACCLGPAALAAVGLGGLGFGIYFARFSGALVAAAVVLLALGWKLYLTERRRCARVQCRMTGGKTTLITLSLASVIVVGFAALHLWPVLNQVICGVSCPRPP